MSGRRFYSPPDRPLAIRRVTPKAAMAARNQRLGAPPPPPPPDDEPDPPELPPEEVVSADSATVATLVPEVSKSTERKSELPVSATIRVLDEASSAFGWLNSAWSPAPRPAAPPAPPG